MLRIARGQAASRQLKNAHGIHALTGVITDPRVPRHALDAQHGSNNSGVNRELFGAFSGPRLALLVKLSKGPNIACTATFELLADSIGALALSLQGHKLVPPRHLVKP
jgi:hypothetical protein